MEVVDEKPLCPADISPKRRKRTHLENNYRKY